MIITVVGNIFSDKAKVAQDISRCTDGQFQRLKMYYTGTNAPDKNHMKMSMSEYEKLNKDDVFYSATDTYHEKYVALKSQFTENDDTVWVVDDPRCLENIESLGIPYSVVFVDCSETAIMNRALMTRENQRQVKLRLERLKSRMKKLDKSSEYSLYLNTSSMSHNSRYAVVSVYCGKVDTWRFHWQEGKSLRMPTIAETVGVEWTRGDNAMFTRI